MNRLDIYGRPFITHRYQKKIRILATTSCSHFCPFCHNEGQRRDIKRDLQINKLISYLPLLRNFSNRATISGGEPLQAANIREIVGVLMQTNFDVTLDTSGAEISSHPDLFGEIFKLHVTIASLDRLNALSSCNGDLDEKLGDLKWLHQKFPTLAITVNVPVVNVSCTAENFGGYLDLAYEMGVRLEFIGEFRFATGDKDTNRFSWEERWYSLLKVLREKQFTPLSVNGREVVYENPGGVVAKITEVACAGVDHSFSNGQCFDNMDVTVDPNLNIKLCRWQENAINVESLPADSLDILENALVSLAIKDSRTCPYEVGEHPIIRSGDGIGKFVFLPHSDWPPHCEEAHITVQKLVRNRELSYFGSSGIVSRFEKEFARYHNTSFAIGVSSGTCALYLAYLALDLCEGAEVIVPIYSYPGTITPLLLTGARIVFCDVEPDTGNMDVDSFKSVLSRKTKGIVVTHMWGNPVALKPLVDVCKDYDVAIVEDCSHAFGAEYCHQKVGTFGDIACFSLQANKAVCAGEGGVFLTNERDLFERAIMLSSLRERVLDVVRDPEMRRYWDTGLGLKLKIHPFAAAYALAFFHRLEKMNADRNYRLDRVSAALKEIAGISPPTRHPETTKHVHYTFKPILNDSLIQRRDEIVQRLVLEGLDAKVPDTRPLNHSPLFELISKGGFIADHSQRRLEGQRNPSRSLGEFRGADKYYRRVISLPAFTNEPIELVDYYIAVVQNVFESINREKIEQFSKL